jgi:metal-dependent amidase/aminoacylase/carboxypeptidase family protein
MNLVDSFADVSRFVRLRRDIHAHPELGFEEHRTSEIVAGLLREWGIEVHTGVAGTGVVGVLKCGDGPRTIGLRADLDALPLQEENHFPHRSTHDGRMHACGHDGHTTMLLAAAWHLSQTRDFSGTVNFIFQPAEEMGKAGALKMIQDGLFDRFPCQAVFALHNFALGDKGKPGDFALNESALMASSNTWRVTMVGRGTHASLPHTGLDPVGAVIDLGQQLQALVPRVIDSNERALLAVTQLQGSDAPNVIPDHRLGGRHGAHLLRERHRRHRGRPAPPGGRHCGRTRVQRRHLLPPRLAAGGEPRGRGPLCCQRDARGGGRCGGGRRLPRRDGRRGLCPHAARAPGLLRLHRQWRRRAPPA